MSKIDEFFQKRESIIKEITELYYKKGQLVNSSWILRVVDPQGRTRDMQPPKECTNILINSLLNEIREKENELKRLDSTVKFEE